jgi:phosphoribosylformylglycinamidine cyclo-ligase
VIDSRAWKRPAVFGWLQQGGNVADEEMYRTFNCGLGMVLALSAADAERALALLKQSGENAFIIGHIESHTGEPEVVILK